MKKSTVVISHIVFWILSALLFMLQVVVIRTFPITQDYLIVRYVQLYSTPIFFYIGYLGVWPLIKKRKSLSILLALVIIGLYVVLFFTSKRLFSLGAISFNTQVHWLIFGGIFKFFVDWFTENGEKKSLQKQNIESNLALLKSQINPHFLFNTLHNIDALIIDNQEKASKSLIKLSAIMRYMLHDSQPKTVSLKKEIEYIENYIDLEKLRIINPAFLSLNIRGNFENLKIAPMLFIPFVENAFKHSVNSATANGITIDIYTNQNHLYFSCLNKYDKFEIDKDDSHGIGLSTVRNRLKYIYPNKHTLEIEQSDNMYKANLEIQLDDN